YLLLIKDETRDEVYHQTFEFETYLLNSVLVHLQDIDKSIHKIIKVSTITGDTEFYDVVMVDGKLRLQPKK
ncbi:MAG TPA: hypothetical protein VK982_09200, partial [Bacteroidales bacterium]|nr:hypothetical protein [Bacteroidales bacterium]